MSVLATIGPDVARIVGAPEASSGWIGDWRAWVLAGAVLVAAGMAAPWILKKLVPARPASERAFRKVARNLRLTGGERRLVRALATAHGRAFPVALLLSASAFASARGAIPEGRMSRRDRRRAAGLAGRIGRVGPAGHRA